MTYVTDQTSAELRQHMQRLINMPGWNEPLSHRLWKEIQEQDKSVSMPRTGLVDKNGREICLGDTIEAHYPRRESQTHYGENIPRPGGQYTEPLEPEISTERYVVEWAQGMFHIGKHNAWEEDEVYFEPLSWSLYEYKDRDGLIEAFGGFDRLWRDENCPGEDDLGYLLDQYPPNTEEELMLYLSGCEVVEPVVMIAKAKGEKQ